MLTFISKTAAVKCGCRFYQVHYILGFNSSDLVVCWILDFMKTR